MKCCWNAVWTLIAIPVLCSAQSVFPPSPSESDPALLQGPIIPEEDSRTLIQFDFNGSFQRIPGRPDEAALRMLNLDEATRASVTEAAEAHRKSLDILLADQIDLIKQSTDAIRAGDEPAAQKITRQVYDLFNPDHVRDMLGDSAAAILTPEQATELKRLTDGYWNALLDWELRNAKKKTPEARAQMQDRLLFGIFQSEYREAYQRTLQPYAQKLELIYETAGLNEEQRAAVRQIILDYIHETRFAPTPEQRRAATQQIYEALDEQGRISMLELVLQSN